MGEEKPMNDRPTDTSEAPKPPPMPSPPGTLPQDWNETDHLQHGG